MREADMGCSEVRAALPAYARDGYTSLAMRRHLTGCAACKAELARYEKMLASLGELAEAPLQAPPGLLDKLVRIPADAGLSQTLLWRAGAMSAHLARNRAAYVGGLAVALAGAAGTAVLRSRLRHPATA
jgi:anti-sigma factor RsiW